MIFLLLGAVGIFCSSDSVGASRVSLTLGEKKRHGSRHSAVKLIFFKVFPRRKDVEYLTVTFGSVLHERNELIFQVACERHLRMILPFDDACIIKSFEI